MGDLDRFTFWLVSRPFLFQFILLQILFTYFSTLALDLIKTRSFLASYLKRAFKFLSLEFIEMSQSMETCDFKILRSKIRSMMT